MALSNTIRYVYAKTQQEALKKLKDEMARAQAGLLGEAGRTNVSEYLGWWMENVVSGEVAHRTYHNYLSQIRNHILPALGKKKLKALKLEDAEGLYRSMVVSGLSPATIRYVHAVMRRALGQAVMRGLIPRNVAEGASLPGLGREEAQYLTPEQVKSLLMAAKGNRLEALYIVAVSCGLRQGELLGLRWEEVDLEGHRLTVRRQVQRSRDDTGLIFVPTKGKKSRAIRLASATGSARPKKWRRRRASGRTPVSCSPAP